MIVNQLSSTRRQYLSWYSLGLIYLLLAALQPFVIKAELTGIEACQNRCFNRLECHEIGNGLCCQWDNDVGQCISSIGSDICPGTATMLAILPGPNVDCPPTGTSLVDASRNLSKNLAQSAPSTSPSSDDKWYKSTIFTLSQLKTVIISYKVTAALSILGSSYIIQDILRDPQKRNESTYHRIMLGLSSSDIIISFFGPFLGTWVMPTGKQITYAVGFKETCDAAAFFAAIGAISTLLYSCSLATFYILKLKYSWVNRKVKGIEKWLLFLPCTLGLIYAIVPAATSKHGHDTFICSSSDKVLGFFYLSVIIFSLSYVTIAMIIVYMAVHKVEKDAEKYTFARYTKRKQKLKMSRRIMVQGILYSAALASQCLTLILVNAIPELDSNYEVEVLSSILFPLQGFWNGLIYMMPVIQKFVKNRCKSQQNDSGSVHYDQNTSKTNWLTRLRTFWKHERTSKDSKNSNAHQVRSQDEESKKEEDSEDHDGVGVLNVNSSRKQEEQIMDVNANDISSLSNNNKKAMFKEIEEEGTDLVTTSTSLMLSNAEQQEEAGAESLSFTTLLSQNSELEKKRQSRLEYFSALEELNNENNDNIDDRDSDSDDESYVDDYLRMMRTEW